MSAYSVFISRATSLEWGTTDSDPTARSPWGFNDGKVVWAPGDESGLIAWFQVGTNLGASGKRRLPVQPMVACAEDTLRRFGDVVPTGLQMLLPVQLADEAYWHLIGGLSWFGVADPSARQPIRVTLDGGNADDVQRLATDIFKALKTLNTGHWTFEGYSTAESDRVRLKPPFAEEMWMGVGYHAMTIEATAPEWNLDAASWVTAFCAEACRLAGVSTSVLVSVTNQPAS